MRRRFRLALLGLALLPCFSVQAEPTAEERGVACPALACMDGVALDVPPDYRWPAGDYVFGLTMDGQSMTCRGSLPFKSCDESGLVCDGDGATITQSGCALPPEAHGFGAIRIPSNPQQVSVTVTRNGQILVSKNFTPAYREVGFGDKRCNIHCRQAMESLLP